MLRRRDTLWFEALRSGAVASLSVALAGALFWYALAHRPAPERAARVDPNARDLEPVEMSPVVATTGRAEPWDAAPMVAATPSAPAPARIVDEVTLMTELRALVNTAPVQALELARRGDALFPNSSDAPERAWAAVKSLDLLKRFHEAQAEARVMLRLYPATSWTEDVERHVLLYPLDQPSREEQQAAANAAR